MDSHREVVESHLSQMRLSQSPDSLVLFGEERREELRLSFEPEPNSYADVAEAVLSCFNSQENRIRNMEIVDLIDLPVFTVDLRQLRDDISFGSLLQVLVKYSINSIVFFDPPHDFLPSQSVHTGILLVPSFLLDGFFERSSVFSVDFFTLRQFIVFDSIFSEHVGDIAVDHTVCEEELAVFGVDDLP